MKQNIKSKTDTEIELDKKAAIDLKRHISSKKAKKGMSYADIAKALTEMGRPITEQGLKNKISRGTFQATWYRDLMRILN